MWAFSQENFNRSTSALTCYFKNVIEGKRRNHFFIYVCHRLWCLLSDTLAIKLGLIIIGFCFYIEVCRLWCGCAWFRLSFTYELIDIRSVQFMLLFNFCNFYFISYDKHLWELTGDIDHETVVQSVSHNHKKIDEAQNYWGILFFSLSKCDYQEVAC